MLWRKRRTRSQEVITIYTIDWDKVKTVDDVIVLLKTMLPLEVPACIGEKLGDLARKQTIVVRGDDV